MRPRARPATAGTIRAMWSGGGSGGAVDLRLLLQAVEQSSPIDVVDVLGGELARTVGAGPRSSPSGRRLAGHGRSPATWAGEP